MLQDIIQPISRAYQQICEGKDPWVALGNFINDFFGYRTEMREALLKEPIQEPEIPTWEQHRWAVFCAASTEYLSQKYGLSCPDWVHHPAYASLTEAWYTGLGSQRAHVQERLRKETPEPFARRNIFCGSRIFANKYEIEEDLRQRRLSA